MEETLVAIALHEGGTAYLPHDVQIHEVVDLEAIEEHKACARLIYGPSRSVILCEGAAINIVQKFT